MKNGLLASTALVGASLLATAASAQTPSVGSNFNVSIDGTVRVGFLVWDQDVGFGTDASTRGYKFQTDESEIRFRMRGTADNGIAYGFDIEMQTQTDDTTNVDETWMFIESGWGRVELGDQDGAANRMFVGGEDRLSGRGGWNGDLGDINNEGSVLNDSPSLNGTGDHTKVTYFTPRWAGLQLGGSWTPDESQDGGDDTGDDDGTGFENVYEIGLNYTNTFGGASVVGTAVYVGGDHEGGGIGADEEDKEILALGGAVDYMGFGFGVGYGDMNDTLLTNAESAAGADGGDWLTLGLRYTTGPWQVGGGYFTSSEDNASGVPDTNVDAWFVGFDYNIVPGWRVEGDITFSEFENIGKDATNINNDTTLFAIASVMSF
jgi:hypothetical protein